MALSNNLPKPTKEQLMQWSNEAAKYQQQGGGGVGSYLKDVAKNTGQLGGAAKDIVGGTVSLPFTGATDLLRNATMWATGAENNNPSKYRNMSYRAVNGGVDSLVNRGSRLAGGINSLMDWQPTQPAKQAITTPTTTANPTTPKIDTQNITPEQQAKMNARADWQSRQQPTSVQGVNQENINGVPSFSNINPQFDGNGNRLQGATLGTIPSMRQNSASLKDILQSAANAQMPAYNAGTQATVVEDATRGGYYQRRRADSANKKTLERLNNQGKERFAIDRQAALDNDQLQTNSLTRRLLGSNVASAERLGDLERVMADFNLPEQQRLAAMQTRNLLTQAAQKAQNNVVTKLSEELPDGSKRERAVTIDPSTGNELSGIDWSGIDLDQYVTEYANRTGRTKEDVLKMMGYK